MIMKDYKAHILALYDGTKIYHGELHDHSKSGGTSDGKRPLSHWLGAMEAQDMDFAAILDHKQVRHMFEPEWQDGVFLGGTEPGTAILDADAEKNSMHYNMLFENAEPLMELLNAFPEFEYEGGIEGHFIYPRFTRARFTELVEAVFDRGGFFVHPHPMQYMKANHPLEYMFREGMGLEVVYMSLDSQYTKDNYQLWKDILATGYRVYATAGGDKHACAHDWALTSIYATERSNRAYIDRLRSGDFVAGSVGIKMCVGNTRMGGVTDFDGEMLVLAVGDYHKSVKDPSHSYRLDVYSDTGLCLSMPLDCTQTEVVAIKADKDAMFYRAEVVDVTRDLIIAYGNPIWNKANKKEF